MACTHRDGFQGHDEQQAVGAEDLLQGRRGRGGHGRSVLGPTANGRGHCCATCRHAEEGAVEPMHSPPAAWAGCKRSWAGRLSRQTAGKGGWEVRGGGTCSMRRRGPFCTGAGSWRPALAHLDRSQRQEEGHRHAQPSGQLLPGQHKHNEAHPCQEGDLRRAGGGGGGGGARERAGQQPSGVQAAGLQATTAGGRAGSMGAPHRKDCVEQMIVPVPGHCHFNEQHCKASRGVA